MKIFVFALILIPFCCMGHAEDSALAQLKKLRVENLTRLHELLQGRFEAGVVQKEEVLDAATTLFALQRDFSPEKTLRIQWQERIVATERERQALIESRYKLGEVNNLEVLRAAERLLAAEQRVLEMRAES